jgi:RND family efflux transporter MFP subunit
MKSGSKTLLTVIITALAVALGFRIFDGIQARTHAEAALVRETDRAAILTVNVIHPSLGARSEELILPGNIQAFTDTPVYARTNGYLKRWYVDIGARVKSGQLMAEIETPEVDQQYRQARAELGTAQANLQLANSTAERWQDLLKTESVSRQETDEKIGDLAAKKAAVDAASANVKRLEETQSFQKIYAPFDGVITARNIDIGSLVTAGSAGPKELYHMAAINEMRVYVQVPQMNSRAAIPGLPADLTLEELPGRKFRGRVARTSESIDPTSRTLLAEVDVDNQAGLLLPGAYVEVHLKLPAPAHSVTVPVNALLFRSEGLTVAAARNGVVALVPITIGHDYGNSLEVTSGLTLDEQLIVNPPDSIVPGQKVQIVAASQGNPQ